MPQIIFFTTRGCHLCERAKALLTALGKVRYSKVTEVDIATDDALIERYGACIPVLRAQPRGQELAWPFNADELSRWLRGL